MTWDKVTDKRISLLSQSIQSRVVAFINECEQSGFQLRITQGLRTIEEQNELYAQGRTKKGKIVTNAKGGYSYHNYGLAFDVVVMKEGKPVWERLNAKIVEIAKKYNFEWGGDWKKPDYPHFQESNINLNDLRNV